MKTILITGINGYLGSHLAKAFSTEYNIIGLEYSLDNLYRISDCNYKVYSAKEGISDSLFTEHAIDIIMHTATFYGKKNEDSIQMFNTNLYSPLNLFDKAIKYKCQLFVNTDTVLDRFVSTYALTKRHFQEWLFIRKTEIKIINMQLEHFYGPGASTSNFITDMITKLKRNEPQINLTFGEQQRDFVYIDDVVDAYLTVIKNQDKIADSYTSFQVCTNELISIKELINTIKYYTHSNSVLNFGALLYRDNELMISESNNTELCKLGWEPKVKIEQGIAKIISMNHII